MKVNSDVHDPALLAGLQPEDVYAVLGSRTAGLSVRRAQDLRSQLGPNRLERVRAGSLIHMLGTQFVNLFALLLWVGSILAFATGQPFLGLVIIAVIGLNGVVGVWQEYRAERAVTALTRLLPETVAVIRDGKELRASSEDLVPGDVIILREGDRVSADSRLVAGTDLRVDESTLTGESHPVLKSDRPVDQGLVSSPSLHNLVYAGTNVLGGSGQAVVYATGMSTQFGKIARLSQAQAEPPSPLQIEVADAARRVAILSAVMGGVIFAIGYGFADLSLRDGALFAVGIVIGNVPEGLLPTMTVCLAMGVQRMAKRNAIIKRLSSVETLGSCTVICADKTGTITENQMTVREVWADHKRVQATGQGYHPRGEFLIDQRPLTDADMDPFLQVLRIGALCNSAGLQPPKEADGPWEVSGDPTEVALLVAARKAGLDSTVELASEPLVRQMSFDPVRKRMSTIHRVRTEDSRLVTYVKGSPHELLDYCSHALLRGNEVAMDAGVRDEIIAEIERMARLGLRVLAMARRYLPQIVDNQVPVLKPGDIEQDLVFVGLVGMHDPPREGVSEAVKKCNQAGIRIVMITGDYGLTAESIARQVGIFGSETSNVIDCSHLDALADSELSERLEAKHLVFARASPQHKLRIVSLLQHRGEIVAVTGDGVNDAPALKRADIGIAMGLGGTDVAREAADMILADDNFATIVAAVEEGRAIFDNMRKFVVYVFAHLAPQAIPFILFALFNTPLPLAVMQILAIDLGTELLPALALGVEKPEPDVMSRPPRPRSQHLLDFNSVARGYGFLGLMTTGAVLAGFFLFLHAHGWAWAQPEALDNPTAAQAKTVVFVTIVLMQISVGFACRTERTSVFSRGLFSNRFLLFGIAFELLFALTVVYVPFLQPIFSTAPIGLEWWLLPAPLILAVFLLEEARKLYLRRSSSYSE